MSTWSEIGPRLISFADLEDNWDSYGAKAPARGAIQFAIAWLAALHEEQPALPAPRVYPGVDGDVSIEWDGPETDAGITVAVGHDGQLAEVIVARGHLGRAGPWLAACLTAAGRPEEGGTP